MSILNRGKIDLLEKITISQIESGFEPELFKDAFKEGWSNYDH